MQNGPSWMIVDSNETPGGLASTDVTPEGFVSNFSPQKPEPVPSVVYGANKFAPSSTTLVAMLYSPTTNTLMIVLMRHCPRKMIGILTSASHMFVARISGFPTPSKTTSPCYQKRNKSIVWMVWSMQPLRLVCLTPNPKTLTSGLCVWWALELQIFSCDLITSKSGQYQQRKWVWCFFLWRVVVLMCNFRCNANGLANELQLRISKP